MLLHLHNSSNFSSNQFFYHFTYLHTKLGNERERPRKYLQYVFNNVDTQHNSKGSIK